MPLETLDQTVRKGKSRSTYDLQAILAGLVARFTGKPEIATAKSRGLGCLH